MKCGVSVENRLFLSASLTSSTSIRCFTAAAAEEEVAEEFKAKMGPGGRNGIRVPVATERKPNAMASSVACCLFNATYCMAITLISKSIQS